MQYGDTPAIAASLNGHTETLALLLANKADVNSADKVQKFKLYSCLQFIYNELQDKDISVYIFFWIKFISRS